MLQKKIGVSLFILLGIFLMAVLIIAPSLTVVTPVHGSAFNYSKILYNLSSNETSDFYILKNRLRSSPTKLCDDNTTCIVNVTAREGWNNITIKVINSNGDIVSSDIDFLVDTRNPRRITSNPRNNSYMNSSNSFSVDYSEENLVNISLYYGNTTEIRKSTNSSCESGIEKTCVFSVSLSDFDGQVIRFWFNLADIVNNRDNSSLKLITVDTDKPVVSSKNFSIEGRRVNFVLGIEEENFDKIILRDNSAIRPRWVRLCSRLIVGTCTARKTFQSGVHAVDIKVLDVAGNSEDIYSNLIINV